MKERICIICDSFKGSASSIEVGNAIAKGIQSVSDACETVVLPIADGGEGTVETIINACDGIYRRIMVTGPYGDKIESKYGIVGTVAYLEVAETSGLTRAPKQPLQTRYSTSFGLGEQIVDAIHNGCTRIYIGLGVSATNDGGFGMAQALGYRFLDRDNHEVPCDVMQFTNVVTIDDSKLIADLSNIEILVLTDVQNTICGDQGSSAVFGPQKGVLKEDVLRFDESLYHLTRVMEKSSNLDLIQLKGGGAAGGLGVGLVALTHAHLRSGIDEMMKILDVEKVISQSDLVITGEGRIDEQTLQGKVPFGIAKISQKYHKPVIAIVGSQSMGAYKLYDYGIDLILDIVNEPMTLEDAFTKVCELLQLSGIHAYNAWKMIAKYRIE